MVFLVVYTDSYDLFLGLNFLMKIGIIIDVEKKSYKYTMEMNF